MKPAPITIPAEPAPFLLQPSACALLVIDMQRDFLEADGFGASLGNDVALLQAAVEPIAQLLTAWRARQWPIWHTREGHLSDLSDLPPAKRDRGTPLRRIGEPGPLGRLLVRGEPGHAIISALAPLPDEPIIDKPGKGAFYATDFGAQLTARGIRQLVVVGVTTEVCVHSTVREANDRGFECLVPSDATASYFPAFHAAALAMIQAQGGIFGWVTSTARLVSALPAPSLS